MFLCPWRSTKHPKHPCTPYRTPTLECWLIEKPMLRCCVGVSNLQQPKKNGEPLAEASHSTFSKRTQTKFESMVDVLVVWTPSHGMCCLQPVPSFFSAPFHLVPA